MAKARRKAAKTRRKSKTAKSRIGKAKSRKLKSIKSKSARRARVKSAMKAPPAHKVRKPKNLTDRVSEAIQTVVDTIKDTTQLRRDMPAQQREQ